MKCGSLPAKADVTAQKKFYEDILHPLMEQALKGEVTLLFLDASHFVMGCDFLGYLYGKTRKFIRTWSGRKRYNVLGAIDFISKKVHTVTNESYITATEVCEMLKKLHTQYTSTEIHLVLDNARYQKCKVVQETAVKLGIYLEYIPPYSPNLNLIERLWKFVKGELRTKYYDKFDTFCNKIDSIIDSTTQNNKSKFEKLIGEKIQLFDDVLFPSNNISFNNNYHGKYIS